MACNNGIVIPTPLTEDPCKGETKSTNCIIHPDALVLLELPADSSMYTIVNTFTVALSSALTRVDDLEALTVELEARIFALENA